MPASGSRGGVDFCAGSAPPSVRLPLRVSGRAARRLIGACIPSVVFAWIMAKLLSARARGEEVEERAEHQRGVPAIDLGPHQADDHAPWRHPFKSREELQPGPVHPHVGNDEAQQDAGDKADRKKATEAEAERTYRDMNDAAWRDPVR